MRVHWIGFVLLAAGLALAGCQKPAGSSANSAAPEGTNKNESGTAQGSGENGGGPAASSAESSKTAAKESKTSNNTNPSTTQNTFTATLSGTGEVPPVTSVATGKATFHVDYANQQIHYTLDVHGLKDVTMAHLHMAPAGENGAIAVWLYPSQPPQKLIEGVSNGNIAKGTITASNLTGPLEGKPLSDLIAKMGQGGLYVNVHTKQNPSGEIRGQVK